MLSVPTALLQHTTRTGSHYDWLVGSQDYLRDPASGLWTVRIGLSSRHWRAAKSFDMVALSAHRRIYLAYQGPISGNRGTVVRVDQGKALIRLWREDRILLDVQMQGFEGQMEVIRKAGIHWRASVVF